MLRYTLRVILNRPQGVPKLFVILYYLFSFIYVLPYKPMLKPQSVGAAACFACATPIARFLTVSANPVPRTTVPATKGSLVQRELSPPVTEGLPAHRQSSHPNRSPNPTPSAKSTPKQQGSAPYPREINVAQAKHAASPTIPCPPQSQPNSAA